MKKDIVLILLLYEAGSEKMRKKLCLKRDPDQDDSQPSSMFGGDGGWRFYGTPENITIKVSMFDY